MEEGKTRVGKEENQRLSEKLETPSRQEGILPSGYGRSARSGPEGKLGRGRFYRRCLLEIARQNW